MTKYKEIKYEHEPHNSITPSEAARLLSEIANLKKQIEILEEGNDRFCAYGSPISYIVGETKQRLKEFREGSEE